MVLGIYPVFFDRDLGRLPGIRDDGPGILYRPHRERHFAHDPPPLALA